MTKRDFPVLVGDPPDERLIMSAWEKFLVDQQSPGSLIRRVIQDSWKRCRTTHVDPHLKQALIEADAARIEQLRRRHAEVREAAGPVLHEARALLNHSDTLLLLTDPAGLILDMEGDPRAIDRARAINLVVGGAWCEAVAGTNAIGTALAIHRPIQLIGGEHFCEGIKGWTCAAEVIRDPHDGQPLGVIDVSGLVDTFHSHSLAFVVSAARQIEANLIEGYFRSRTWVLEACVDLFGRWPGDGLIAVDSRGRLVKAGEHAGTALQELGVDAPLARETRIAGLNMALAERERTAALPAWLRLEWLHPIVRGRERIGTLIVVPLREPRAQHARRHTAAGNAARAQGFARILGRSPALQQAVEKARRLARVPAPVLLLGETGVGKEIFARAIHEEGPTASGPFVALNCGALSRELLPSELFGYVEGAFTGARRGGMPGKFEAADGGTLFLDEIGEMPLELQPQLLRVLQEREVVRLGDSRARKVNVRILAATNRDLRAEVARGNFRRDLYYRLSVATLQLPPLRDREDDLEILFDHFQTQLAREYNCRPRAPDPDVWAALHRYRWPGNVRELHNVVESMLLLAAGEHLTLAELPDEIADTFCATAESAAQETNPVHAGRPRGSTPPPPSDSRLTTLEREAILAAISTQGGNLTRAARQLGIARSTLYKKMEHYGIARD